MKKLLLILLTAPVFTACYTTNDVFVPEAEMTARSSHELVISTTLPIIALPQNIGFNYRYSSPVLLGSGWKVNAFARYERGLRRVLTEWNDFYGGADRIKSDNVKFMLMPSYHFSEDAQVGIGVGLEYAMIVDEPVSNMYLPMLNLNLNKIASKDEEHVNSWNLNFSICDRFNKTDGVYYRKYENITAYDSTVYHQFYDPGSSLIWKSLKWSFTHQKMFLSNPGVSAVFRFDIGITVIGDFKRASEVIDGQKYPGFTYDSHEGVNFPFGFSMGLKF
ncbi:MAG: hypothetical protein ACO1O6_07055 [Bacteroidota bacterium]